MDFVQLNFSIPNHRFSPFTFQYEDEDDEDEAVVETEEDEDFSHFHDDEEFEGFDSEGGGGGGGGRRKQQEPLKDIKINTVPAHFTNNWENYYLEILMAAGIVVYFLNFFAGKTKNQKIANAWFNTHKALLESNFALVGDDGAKNVEDIETQLVKEAEHIFTLWCSGRICCDGMLAELKLLKRQDLVSVMSNIVKSGRHDQVQIKVDMEDMDAFVFCLANRKSAGRLAKEMTDINTFCPEKRGVDKYGIPAQFCLMSEIHEVAAAMIDSKMTAILNKYPDHVDSVHFSDQFTGQKPADDQQPTELPEGKKVLIFTYNIILKGKSSSVEGSSSSIDEAVENMKPLMLLVFYFIEKVRRYRLSREGKNKAEKNRSKVAEVFWKSVHAARAERAQEERERKKREMKERIMEIEDPEKQRKLEERENRKEKKRAQPKMKQLKVKAM